MGNQLKLKGLYLQRASSLIGKMRWQQDTERKCKTTDTDTLYLELISASAAPTMLIGSIVRKLRLTSQVLKLERGSTLDSCSPGSDDLGWPAYNQGDVGIHFARFLFLG